jgi:preprotein translocase subunit SecG
MGVVKIVLTVLEVIFSIGLTAVVLLQSGKEAGLSGAIAGNADTYMGKGKSGSLDQKLASWTKWIALVWAVLTLALGLI